MEEAAQVLENLVGYDLVFLQFLKNCLQIVAPERKIITPLKNLYIVYKKKAVLAEISPMKYKIFRAALGSALLALKKDVEMYQRNKTWLISNVALVETDALVELYQKFYNLNKKEVPYVQAEVR